MPKVISKLKALREKAEFSQRKLARLVGETQSNIQYWETTGKIPRSDVLTALAKALNVKVDDLLDSSKPRPEADIDKIDAVLRKVAKLPNREQARVLKVIDAMMPG